jgi:hypothetical protein
MGQIRANFSNELCLNGHPGPCSADHIGPLSLGFTHRPEFQLLCKSCNSGKNNRMSLREVAHLRKVEASGETIISWHSKALWDLRKADVVSNETALRLSKLLRDNRHTLMSILQRIANAGYFTFLATFLELIYAERNVEFINLHIEEHITKFDRIIGSSRGTRYVDEQKSRRCRVAFEALRDYFRKENRNAYIVSTALISTKVDAVLQLLEKFSAEFKKLDSQISQLLSSTSEVYPEEGFRAIVGNIPKIDASNFLAAKRGLAEVMELVAIELSKQWNSDRYVRGELNLDS